MKTKGSIWSYLFSPFRYIAGKESLLVGIGVLAILFILGYWSNTHFDGVLDVHYACLTTESPISVHALYQLIAWFSLVVVLYPTARVFSSSSVRLIDIAGTMAVARFPLIFAALWGLNPDIHICMEGVNPFDSEAVMAIMGDKIAITMCSALFGLLILVWYIRVLYNAYSVSSNLKGSKGGWTFAIGLIISEILSIVLIKSLVF